MGEQPSVIVNYQFREGEVRVVFEGFEVLSVLFYSDNYSKALFEYLKQSDPFLTLSEEQRIEIYAQVREKLAEQGIDASNEKN